MLRENQSVLKRSILLELNVESEEQKQMRFLELSTEYYINAFLQLVMTEYYTTAILTLESIKLLHCYWRHQPFVAVLIPYLSATCCIFL